jgi:hypothetical protein
MLLRLHMSDVFCNYLGRVDDGRLVSLSDYSHRDE